MRRPVPGRVSIGVAQPEVGADVDHGHAALQQPRREWRRRPVRKRQERDLDVARLAVAEVQAERRQMRQLAGQRRTVALRARGPTRSRPMDGRRAAAPAHRPHSRRRRRRRLESKRSRGDLRREPLARRRQRRAHPVRERSRRGRRPRRPPPPGSERWRRRAPAVAPSSAAAGRSARSTPDGLGGRNQPSDTSVGVAERNAVRDQPVGQDAPRARARRPAAACIRSRSKVTPAMTPLITSRHSRAESTASNMARRVSWRSRW